MNPTRDDKHGSGVVFLYEKSKGVLKGAVYQISKLEVID